MLLELDYQVFSADLSREAIDALHERSYAEVLSDEIESSEENFVIIRSESGEVFRGSLTICREGDLLVVDLDYITSLDDYLTVRNKFPVSEVPTFTALLRRLETIK